MVSSFEKIYWDKEFMVIIVGIQIDLKDKINQFIVEKLDVLMYKIDLIIGKKVNLIKLIWKIWINF